MGAGRGRGPGPGASPLGCRTAASFEALVGAWGQHSHRELKESKESPEATWPKDIIALEPVENCLGCGPEEDQGASSDSVEKEWETGEGRQYLRGQLSARFGGQGIRFHFLVLCQFPRSYFKSSALLG